MNTGRRPAARHGWLLALLLTTFAAGASLVLLFEALVPRVAGALILIVFIVAGVFLVADPDFLEADDD